ncbi:MAG TPA: hypothetical protein DCL15_06395 [Chloroflexi bacterium]|nr:hypothetical protein [Chloroflexota bacterium]
MGVKDGAILLAGDKALAVAHGMTFAEYCQVQADRGRLLRMRYDETRLLPALQAGMIDYPDALVIVALVTAEDPDTTAVLPVIARLLAASCRVQLRIFTDADVRPLTTLLPDIDLSVALEEWDLPQFLVFDDEWELQTQWGPRPEQAERNLLEWLSRYPEYETLADDESVIAQERFSALTTKLIHEMRVWYNSSLAAACQREFYDILAALLAPDEMSEGEK